MDTLGSASGRVHAAAVWALVQLPAAAVSPTTMMSGQVVALYSMFKK